MANLSKTVRTNLPFVIKSEGQALNKREINSAYVILEGCNTEFDFGQNNNGWSRLKSAIHTNTQKLVKEGVLFQPSRGLFDVVAGVSVPTTFQSFLGATPPVVVDTPPDFTFDELVEPEFLNGGSNDPGIEITDTVEVVSTPIELDTDPQDEVEVEEEAVEVADEVEDEVVVEDEVEEEAVVEDEVEVEQNPSSVQVSTSTLSDTQPTSEVRDAVEETTSTLEDMFELEGVDTEDEPKAITYNIKELRKKASFDPFLFKGKLEGELITGEYEVYRDFENLNLVVTQKGREDYVIVPMDVQVEDEEMSEKEIQKYQAHADKALAEFKTKPNHKLGASMVVKSVTACCHRCQHTDAFAGLVEGCTKPCPVPRIWGKGAIYVDPTQ